MVAFPFQYSSDVSIKNMHWKGNVIMFFTDLSDEYWKGNAIMFFTDTSDEY
jgi:hypothetical protein